MKEKKKNHILETAEKLFNRFGVKKTAVDEIATKAQVAKGTIYNYFGSKEGIISELINSKLMKFDEIMEKTLAAIKDPVEKLRFIISERLKLSIENPFLTEKELIPEEMQTGIIKKELDARCRKLISGILPKKEKTRENENEPLIKTILYTIKGMDEYIAENTETANLNTLRGDIECLTDLVFPQNPKEA